MEVLENLFSIGCTDYEVAGVLGISTATLERRKREPAFREVCERGPLKGNASLRRSQFQTATGGNPAMLIWLGKQRLGQLDRQRVDIGVAPDRVVDFVGKIAEAIQHNVQDPELRQRLVDAIDAAGADLESAHDASRAS
jgi:hypothetical protein